MDEQLLNDLKAGKNQAFEQIYKDYYKMTATFVKNNSGTENDARDVFQEAMIALVKSIRKPTFKLTAKLSTYLFSIARQIWLYKIRQNKRLPLADLNETNDTFIELGEEDILLKKEFEDTYLLVEKYLQTMKDGCRTIIMDFYYKKFSLSIIAEKLGIQPNSAKLKKHRCMKSLQKKLAKDPEYKKLRNIN